jgi:hypothetical protein
MHIGNFPVGEFEFPKFRFTMRTKPGVYHDWRIWDGSEAVKVGDLPEQYRSLELKTVWGDQGLEEQIVAGTCRGDRML